MQTTCTKKYYVMCSTFAHKHVHVWRHNIIVKHFEAFVKKNYKVCQSIKRDAKILEVLYFVCRYKGPMGSWWSSLLGASEFLASR